MMQQHAAVVSRLLPSSLLREIDTVPPILPTDARYEGEGGLAHDDRLDAVAGSVSYWVDSMAQDAAKAAQKNRDKIMEKELKAHFANQIDKTMRSPGSARKRRRKDGFTMKV